MLHSQLCMFTQVHVHVHVYSTVVVFNSPVSVASHASSRVVVVRRGCRSACGVHVAVHARSGRGTCGGGALTFATFVFCKALTHFARKLCTLHEPRQHEPRPHTAPACFTIQHSRQTQTEAHAAHPIGPRPPAAPWPHTWHPVDHVASLEDWRRRALTKAPGARRPSKPQRAHINRAQPHHP